MSERVRFAIPAGVEKKKQTPNSLNTYAAREMSKVTPTLTCGENATIRLHSVYLG
jgi:hypothetical protein